jgi:hypothetical protein
MLVGFVVPLAPSELWHSLKFNKIPPNVVLHSQEGIEIKVAQSASPLIYKLPQVKTVRQFTVKGSVSKGLLLQPPLKQGEKASDDFQFRLGLVVTGEKKLSGFKKWISPEWVRELFALAPADTGLDQIYFYNLALKGVEPEWKTRTHPLSDLISESISLTAPAGDFELSQVLDPPKSVGAIWISCDGDQTKSEYTVKIKSIVLEN